MSMLKLLSKSMIFAVLLTLAGSQLVSAEVRQYQYDGKMPFVQMMLAMMSAMGILDRVPVNGLYGSSGYPGSSLNNPYARALAMRGLSPALLQNPYTRNSALRKLYGGYPNSTYGNNPFMSSPWLQSPWTQSGLNSASPVWGSPSWGVLPLESYTLNNYAPYGSRWQSPAWSASDLSGWVNEPWETSTWNPKAETSRPPSQSSMSPPQNYHAPDEGRHPAQQQLYNGYQPSPLSKLLPPPDYRPDYRPDQQRAQPYRRPPDSYSEESPEWPSDIELQQKPCVTDFCGLKKPNLNGLWVAQNGEMLGIKNQKFLWNDGSSRYLTGLMKIQNEYLLASVEGSDRLMQFKYKLAGNHLLTLQPDGVIREFTRMPINQYPYDAQYQGYDPNYDSGYYP